MATDSQAQVVNTNLKLHLNIPGISCVGMCQGMEDQNEV